MFVIQELQLPDVRPFMSVVKSPLHARSTAIDIERDVQYKVFSLQLSDTTSSC